MIREKHRIKSCQSTLNIQIRCPWTRPFLQGQAPEVTMQTSPDVLSYSVDWSGLDGRKMFSNAFRNKFKVISLNLGKIRKRLNFGQVLAMNIVCKAAQSTPTSGTTRVSSWILKVRRYSYAPANKRLWDMGICRWCLLDVPRPLSFLCSLLLSIEPSWSTKCDYLMVGDDQYSYHNKCFCWYWWV